MMGSEYEARPEEADRIEQLLRRAPARERPSAVDEQAIREALRAEWLAEMRRRRWRRAGWGGAGIAAVLALAVIAVPRPPPAPDAAAVGARLARIEAFSGRIRIRHDGPDGAVTAEPGTALRAGQEVVTADDGGLALLWRDGSSVRIDQRTKLRLTPAGAVDLVGGRVYVDAGTAAADAEAPVVLTPAGPVRHVGTQYMAAVAAGATRISVRAGVVALTADGVQHTASGGQQLSVSPGGQSDLGPIPVYGADWLWAEALAAPFAADGRSVAEFLDWVGRETGHRVEFDSAAAEERARTSQLHGAIALEPLRALEPVLQTANLVASVHNGIIRVRLRTDD